jgi:nucleotide-binding universal stress UspA family protein
MKRDRASKEIAMTDEMGQKMKLLIAYDGSSFADVALGDLLRAGLPSEAEACVLSVADVWGPPASFQDYDQATSELDKEIRVRAQELRKRVAAAVDEARALAMKAAQQVHAAFPTWKTRAEACCGSPAWELIKKAEEWQADLLITGTRGRGAMDRLLLGSVSQKVLNEARCSVRIARPHTGIIDAPPRVLIAVDGSEHAEAAVRAASARVWPAGTEIRLIAADDPFKHPPAGYTHWLVGEPSPGDVAETRNWISKVIAAPTQTLRAAGLNVSQAVRWGDARCVILEEATAWSADTIFLGARGLGRFHRLMLGSVSSAVAARASCTVEVVRVAKQ